MTDVRTLLHELAAEAPRDRGEETADRVVDLHRAQDRRRLRIAGVAAAIAVVVAAVPALVTRSSPTDTAVSAADAAAVGEDEPDLLGLPTRGSLAGDDQVRLAALAADWGDAELAADPGSRRVAFLGEVPGGQVWALVLGEHAGQPVYAWFVDTDAPGVLFQLVSVPDRAFPDTPMGLLDVADGSGSLVVVSSPGDEISYASDGSATATGSEPVWTSLPSEDGVAVATVSVGDQYSAFAGYRVERDGVVVSDLPPQTFDARELALSLPVEAPAGPGDPALAAASLAECLTTQGYRVTLLPDGGYQVDAVPTDQGLATLAAAQAFCTARLAEAALDD